MTISKAAEFGKAIKERRKVKGYTQADISAVSGLSVSFISDLENGKKSIELEKALMVANLLGLDINLSVRG
ncbi:MAG: helix-turn-helix domain-containing protein [Lachnospiraceae bacterium]|nr:helix-turn-helix domain-containing protein [Lachnospiraceae bacterium]